MISTLSRLSELHRALVLDANVALNLLGSGRPADVLRLLGREAMIEELVLAEVQRDPSSDRPAREGLDVLREAGLLRYERLSERGYLRFLALTGATPPDDLGDGEAATIAHADEVGAAPVTDDRKAARILGVRRPGEVALTTMDLLASAEVISGLPKDELAELVFAALSKARMRVVPLFRPWVVGLIGKERAALCPSLGKVGGVR